MWLDDVRAISIGVIASEFGIATTSRGLAVCPSCGDERGCNVYAGDGGDRWKCHRCGAGGDAADLASVRLGFGPVSRENSAGVRSWFAARSWCDAAEDYDGPAPVERPRTSTRAAHREAKPYPPRGEVMALFAKCSPVDSDPAGVAWVERRLGGASLPPGVVGILPEGASVPDWATFRGSSWSDLGYRLLFPLVDSEGAIRSVRARHPDEAPDGTPKTLPPAGRGLGGLVLACPTSRAWLRGGWSRHARVVVAEGEPAWLAWVSAGVPAFGIFSGAWQQGHADKIPRGRTVIVATDHNDAGDRYAANIEETTRGHCHVIRWSPHARFRC